MRIAPKGIRRFQEGGAMEAPQEEPMQEAPAQEQDPIMMIAQGAAQALQNQDCQMAMQVCQALLQLLQQGQPTEEETPAEPVYRRGGRLVKRIRK